MENYIVSARKYRPLGFDEVVGQSHVTTTLSNAIRENKLAQALLFCGPRGVGKTTCARIVARLVNNYDEKVGTNALNIFELDAASNNSVDDIRNLTEQIRYPPQSGLYKVYIIDEVHMLSNAAFNAFLKTLEEPPSYAIFILATTEKHKIIPTILSRCQIFDFNRIQISDGVKQLKKIADQEGIKVEEEVLHIIAQKADGALRDALSIFDLMVAFSSGKEITLHDVLSNLHILDYDYYFKVVEGLLVENPTPPLLLLDEILRKGFDGHRFIVGLGEHIRNLMVCHDARTVALMEVPKSTQNKYLIQAKATSSSILLSWLSIVNQCDINYKNSKNQRLLIELALMKMAHVRSLFPSEDLPPLQQKVKKKHKSTPQDTAPSIPPEVVPQKAAIEEKPEIVPQKAATEEKPEIVPQKTATEEKPEIVPQKTATEEKPEIVPQKTATEEKKTQESKHSATTKNELSIPRMRSKQKTTPNLQKLTDGYPKVIPEEKADKLFVAPDSMPRRAISLDELKKVWDEFAEQRKGQIGEYHVLKKDFDFIDDQVILHLSNAVEDPLLQNMKTSLTAYLRSRLNHNTITVKGILKTKESKKIAYTNKEKFDSLAASYPLLHTLQQRMDLDFDY